MRMSELDYHLPAELVATHPAEPRDASRLMVVRLANRTVGELTPQVHHHHFHQIHQFLRPGDLLVVNNTRVVPAKLSLRRHSGAIIQGLFVRELEPALWEVLLRTRGKVKLGEELRAATDHPYGFILEERRGEGLWRVRVTGTTQPAHAAEVLNAIGHVPLPPYIVKQRKHLGSPEECDEDRQWYQTIFARDAAATPSVAAPTAGLHFTPELLARLDAQGVQRTTVELEVGLGTFLPVQTETLEEHIMHRERYAVPTETVAALRAARQENRRIVVVGTTAVRTLEAAATDILDTATDPAEIRGETTLKIAPGFPFRLTDVLITNFHLPKSTLMALVAAFLGDYGVEQLQALYALAVQERYRFYSYGDAMMIDPTPERS